MAFNNGACSQWLPGDRDPPRERSQAEEGAAVKVEVRPDDSYSGTRSLHARTSLYPWVSVSPWQGSWGLWADDCCEGSSRAGPRDGGG